MKARPILLRANLPTQIYSLLKQRIVRNELPFGYKLTEFHLAEELGVSRTPLREALNRLAQDGMVTVIPGRGAFVAKFSPDEIVDLFDVREALEGMAARLATARITHETLARLRSRLEAEMKRRTAHGYSGYLSADREFHEAVTLAGGNRHLAQQLEALTDRIQMLRSRSVTLPGRVVKSFEEHLSIIEALSLRDPDLVEKRMREHIRNVKADLAKSLRINGEAGEEPRASQDGRVSGRDRETGSFGSHVS